MSKTKYTSLYNIIKNKEILSKKNIKNLNKEFKTNKPFPHISINNFLDKKYALKLLKALKNEKYFIKECDLYKFKRTFDFKTTPNKTIQEFRTILIKEFIPLLEEITEINLNKTKITLHSLKFQNTDYLLCHDDIVENRIIAFIFQLSQNWTEKDGGELELFYSQKDKNNKLEPIPNKTKTILPSFGQLNFFEVSEKSFHQIKEILSNKERITIGGWILKK